MGNKRQERISESTTPNGRRLGQRRDDHQRSSMSRAPLSPERDVASMPRTGSSSSLAVLDRFMKNAERSRYDEVLAQLGPHLCRLMLPGRPDELHAALRSTDDQMLLLRRGGEQYGSRTPTPPYWRTRGYFEVHHAASSLPWRGSLS